MKAFLNKHLLKINIPILIFNFLLPLSLLVLGEYIPEPAIKVLVQVFNISFLLQIAIGAAVLILLVFTKIIQEKRVKRLSWVFVVITAIEAVPIIANMTL